jgi:hypothetical protein
LWSQQQHSLHHAPAIWRSSYRLQREGRPHPHAQGCSGGQCSGYKCKNCGEGELYVANTLGERGTHARGNRKTVTYSTLIDTSEVDLKRGLMIDCHNYKCMCIVCRKAMAKISSIFFIACTLWWMGRGGGFLRNPMTPPTSQLCS